jgi:Flp pilus assembly protein TadD
MRREAVARVWSGRMHLEAGDLERAESDLRTAVEYCDEIFPEGDWRPAEARAALGATLVAAGRLEEADPLLREGHRGLVEARGADHPMTRWAAAELNRLDGGT